MSHDKKAIEVWNTEKFIKKLKAVQHVYVVSEQSEKDFRMIGCMMKKLLKFEILKSSWKEVWGKTEKTKSCATCIRSQWTLGNGF